MRKAIGIFVVGVVVGCSGTAPDHRLPGDAGDTCLGHRANDPCMDEERFAECRRREAECPGRVHVLESCPPQFRCP